MLEPFVPDGKMSSYILVSIICREASQAALAAVKAEEQSVLRDITMLKEYMETNVVTIDNKHFSARYKV